MCLYEKSVHLLELKDRLNWAEDLFFGYLHLVLEESNIAMRFEMRAYVPLWNYVPVDSKQYLHIAEDSRPNVIAFGT